MLVYVMNSKSVLIILLLTLLCSLAFHANAQSIYQQSLFRLNADNPSHAPMQTLQQYQGSTLLTSFFMPNCRWCQRQHKVLKKMQQSCPKLNTVMLGVQGSKQKLKYEMQREKNTFPAFVANKQIVQAIGAKSPVPMMLIFDTNGRLAFKTVGYTPEEKLQALLQEHNILVCSS